MAAFLARVFKCTVTICETEVHSKMLLFSFNLTVILFLNFITNSIELGWVGFDPIINETQPNLIGLDCVKLSHLLTRAVNTPSDVLWSTKRVVTFSLCFHCSGAKSFVHINLRYVFIVVAIEMKFNFSFFFFTNMSQVLQEQYETESIAEHGVELLYATLSKIVSSLQEAYEGDFFGFK